MTVKIFYYFTCFQKSAIFSMCSGNEGNRLKCALFFWLQNNRIDKKIRFASYSTTRDYYYENIVFQFSFSLEGNVFTSMYTDVSIYKYTYVHAYAHTHANTHKSLHTQSLTHPPPPHSYTSHTHSLCPYTPTRTLTHINAHIPSHTPVTNMSAPYRNKNSHPPVHSHMHSHTHMQPPTLTHFFTYSSPHRQPYTHTPPQTHLRTLTHVLSQMHPHLPAATHTHTRSLTPMPHRCTHKYTISRHPYAFTPHSHIPACSLSHTHEVLYTHNLTGTHPFTHSDMHVPLE